MVTLANLVCGCAAILYVFVYNDLQTAFWLVILAAAFDFLDGFTARMLKSYSEVGKQLDSLSDMVSFGVVPASILYYIYVSSGGTELGEWTAILPFSIAVFSALRLAKFNVDENQKDEFTGLPTPACAIFMAACGWLFATGNVTVSPVTVLITCAVFSFLLVSPVKMFALKFRNYTFRDNKLRYIFAAASLTAVAVFRIPALPFVIAGYVLVSLICNLTCRKKTENQQV